MGSIRISKIRALDFLSLMKSRKLPSYKNYSWDEKNSELLVEDINKALKSTSYMLGEVVFVSDELLDGVGRLITLSLIAKALGLAYPSICRRWTPDEARRVKSSYSMVQRALAFTDIAEFRRFFSDSLYLNMIELESIEDSFSFFDDGDARGVALEPSDILKAYHLCSMREKSEGEKLSVSAKWESIGRERLHLLLRVWHPLYFWTRALPSPAFSLKGLSSFEGVEESLAYPYVKRLKVHELNSEIVNGDLFFKRCFYYEKELGELLSIIEKKYPSLFDNVDFSLPSESSCFDLFLSLSLLMLDRFGPECAGKALSAIFKFSFALRLEDSSVSLDRINKFILSSESILPVILYSKSPYDVYSFDLKNRLCDMRNIAMHISGPVKAIDFDEDFKRWINE